jgi:hypothetical protein
MKEAHCIQNQSSVSYQTQTQKARFSEKDWLSKSIDESMIGSSVRDKKPETLDFWVAGRSPATQKSRVSGRF